MFKHNGEYYLQYSAGGTQYRSYAIGVYRGKSPLGPFIGQKTPVAKNISGRVCGTGHGCWAPGPDGSVWQFYTVLNRRIHIFERRIGMDKVDFDTEGNASVKITATPQSVASGDLGIVPLSVNKKIIASSSYGCCYANFAVDDCTHTWWMPERDDDEPWLEVDLCQSFTISAFQVIWAEEGVDFKNGITPEAAAFKVEFLENDRKTVIGEVDFSDNTRDLLIDFHMIEPVIARYVRLRFKQSDNLLLQRGVNNFTLFGKRDPVS